MAVSVGIPISLGTGLDYEMVSGAIPATASNEHGEASNFSVERI